MSQLFHKKPVWLSTDDWLTFLKQHPPQCAVTGETDLAVLTIDHIVPRYQGGTNDISNLQWLTFHENQKKGIHPDRYWGEPFYFDQKHNTDVLRTGQYDTYHGVRSYHGDFFARPRGEIAGRLYTYVWVTGSGKTMAVPTIAFAYNELIKDRWGDAAPRADRILVLCKEVSIADQFVEDLQNDITAIGLAGTPPHVIRLTGSDMLTDAVFKQADIFVGCIQLFWRNGGGYINNLAEVLAHFPLIFIDEPHFAYERVSYIVEQAATSICFGFTATPIKGTGESLTQYVLASIYTYDQAVMNDQSLKFVPDDPAISIEELKITEADVMFGSSTSKVNAPGTIKNYPDQLRPHMNVAERVVELVSEGDKILPGGMFNEAAIHRTLDAEITYMPDLWYPLHGLITVDTKEIAEELAQILNSHFEANRNLYPRERGFYAEVVHTGINERTGEEIVGAKPLGRDHPWLYASKQFKQGQDIDRIDLRKAARFLVAVGIGREGTHNLFCGVVGAANSVQSYIEDIQRTIGRQLRGVRRGIHVPPAELDRIHIVIHEAFARRSMTELGIRYLHNMVDFFQDIPTIDDLIAGTRIPYIPELDPEGIFPLPERLRLVDEVGQQLRSGLPIDWQDLSRVFGGTNPNKQRKVDDFIQRIQIDPREAWEKGLYHVSALDAQPVVIHEQVDGTPSIEQLTLYIKTHQPDFISLLGRIEDEDMHRVLNRLYSQHHDRYRMSAPIAHSSLSDIRRKLADTAWRDLRTLDPSLGPRPAEMCYRFAGAAMKRILGTEEGLTNNSFYNTPYHHAILHNPRIERLMRGYVRNYLIRNGCCPNIQKAFEGNI